MVRNVAITLGAGATPLSAVGVRKGCSWLNVQSRSTNNAAGLYLGDSTVVAAGTTGGVKLAPGASFTFQQQDVPAPYDLQHIYAAGTAADVVDVMYVQR